MNNIILNEFLQSGYFIGSPSENKIWCMSSSFKKYSSEKILAPPYFYLNNFYLSKSEPFCKGSSFFELSYSEFLTLLLNEESEKPNIKWEKISNEMYLSQFESLKIEIKENKLKKGVPYSFLKGNSHLTKMNKVYLLKSILESKRQNYSYIYGFWEQDKGFIGTSPELLFTQSGKDIHTIALAGTAPNQLETNKAQFQFDPKIQKEHYYVIDGIKSSLNKFGEVTIGETSILELPKLIHLKTDINIELPEHKNFNFNQFLTEIYPTPAIGTLPKNSKSGWLKESNLENSNRGYFAAPFGIVLEKNKSICICAIRGMQWEGEIVKISAGGGVIKESDLDAEWEEIISKINAIKYNLGL